MSTFSLQVDKWAAKASIDIKTMTKLVAFRVHDRVVERTPVDTGRARASWTIIAGESPDTAVQPPEFSGGAGAGAAVAKSKQGNVALANSYVIANNLPYIESLENGHSKQAPAGMAMLGLIDVKTQLEIELKV